MHASAFGPLFLGPLSEIFGRSRVLQIANLWYLGMWRLLWFFCYTLTSGTSSPSMESGLRLRAKYGAARRIPSHRRLRRQRTVIRMCLFILGFRPKSLTELYIDWWRCFGRLLEARGAWAGRGFVLPRTSFGPSDWSCSRRMGRTEVDMALGVLVDEYRRWSHSSSWPLLLARE